MTTLYDAYHVWLLIQPSIRVDTDAADLLLLDGLDLCQMGLQFVDGVVLELFGNRGLLPVVFHDDRLSATACGPVLTRVLSL